MSRIMGSEYKEILIIHRKANKATTKWVFNLYIQISKQWEIKWYHQSGGRKTAHKWLSLLYKCHNDQTEKKEWETVKDHFLAKTQHGPESDGIHFEISDLYRPMPTEDKKEVFETDAIL